MRILLSGFIFLSIAPVCLAQSSAQNPSISLRDPNKSAFEVASVRETKSGGKATSNIPLDRGEAYSPTGGLFLATNQPVVTLIIFAYKMKVSESFDGLMRKLPSWAITDRFDINARAESAAPSKEDVRLMMQTLLEDRFNLKVHRENRQMPVFGMYTAESGKMGLQLRPHSYASLCSTPLPSPTTGAPVDTVVGLWPANCGDGAESRISKYRLREGGRNMTMSAIADWMTGAGELERPILDRTGLSGTYDFTLEFDPESLDRDSISIAPRSDSGPTFIEAIKEQLGLQLKKEEGASSIFVIDNIEHPSSN
jgi:uncharacterized protein (TIGR03435 family)